MDTATRPLEGAGSGPQGRGRERSATHCQVDVDTAIPTGSFRGSKWSSLPHMPLVNAGFTPKREKCAV